MAEDLAYYEVKIRSRILKNIWSMHWRATSFADAEQRTIEMLLKTDNPLDAEEIISITKDYNG